MHMKKLPMFTYNLRMGNCLHPDTPCQLLCPVQGWGEVQYLYLSTYLSVLDVLEYLVYGNVKVLVFVLDQKVLGTYK